MTEETTVTLESLAPFMDQVGTKRKLTDGEQLIEQGRHDQQAYYITSGSLDVIRDGEHVRRVEAGDLVGEFAFIDNRPRTASVYAVGETAVIEIDRQTEIPGSYQHQSYSARRRSADHHVRAQKQTAQSGAATAARKPWLL